MNQFMKKTRKLLCLIVFAASTVFLCSCTKAIPGYIATSATIEAGNTFLASNFLLEEGHTAAFTEEFAAQFVRDGVARINHAGEYSVGLIVDDETYDIKVTVQDTVAPKASAHTIIVCRNEALSAEQCVSDIKDQTDVTCTFKTEPDLTQIGSVNEIVVLTDEGGNRTEIPVTIKVIASNAFLPENYTIEAGTEVPTIEEVIHHSKTGKYVTDTSVINTSLVGKYPLEIEIEGTIYTTELIIEDTIAPTATVTPIKVYYGATFPAADSFVSEIKDMGPVTVSYDIDPGEKVNNQSAIRIVLTDQGGNKTYYDTQCTILVDNEAPKFVTVPSQLEADLDSSILWRALVSAEDNSGIVELSLDTTGANLKKAGTYTVQLVARDPAGNEARQQISLVIHDNTVTKEMMDQLCAKIISQIITEDMTTQEQLYAVFKYVSTKIKYVNEGVHDDLRREAYLGLTTRKKGDCFTFCAASYQLLDYLGYDIQIVRRRLDLVKKHGNHFWLLVNCGTEEEPAWYHHDSTSHARPYKQETYMMTDAQARAYTNYRAETSGKQHYYTYDSSLHPAVATEEVVDINIDEKYFD